MKFEAWMVGKEVEEISTGDRGVVSGPGLNRDSAYVSWTTGTCKDKTLWIYFDKFVFVDLTEDATDDSIKGKLAQIEKLVAEIKEMI